MLMENAITKKFHGGDYRASIEVFTLSYACGVYITIALIKGVFK